MIRLVLIFCCCTVYLQAHPPWGIVLDSHRNIYFADIFHEERGAVWKLSPEGHLELLLRDFHAHNVSLDREQHLVAAHGEGTHSLVRYRNDEQLDTLFQSEHHADFNGGNCTYSKQGNIYFQADHFVWVIDSSGQKRKFHPHRLEWAQTIYVDENENVYVPDIGIGRGHLYRLPPEGPAELLAVDLLEAENPDRTYQVLLGITKGCDGKMYIAETAGRRIVKIEEDRSTSTFYRSPEGWSPTGIDFFAGDAYILEFHKNHSQAGPRIVKVDESGKITELFNYNTYSPSSPTIDKGTSPEKKGGFLWLVGGGLIALLFFLFLIRKK